MKEYIFARFHEIKKVPYPMQKMNQTQGASTEFILLSGYSMVSFVFSDFFLEQDYS